MAILIALACLYQLSFTAVTRIQENKAVKYAEAAVEAEQQKASFADVDVQDRAYFLDSVRKDRNRYYIDSISAEKVYLGYTFKEVKEKEINLGLDLKGGMNVMLQVELSDLIRALSDYNPSPELAKALELAKQREAQTRSDFITLFEEAWNEVASNQRLSQIFGTFEMREKIRPESTNEEVISVIRQEAESAISNSFNVLRNRIDRFGVTSPNIQRLGNSGRILVELPGVKEPERVRKLLQGTASLEFWTTYENPEVIMNLEEANRVIRDIISDEEQAAPAVAEETAGNAGESSQNEMDALVAQITSQQDSMSAASMESLRNNPLFALLAPSYYNGQALPGPVIGMAHYKDTAQINLWLSHPQVRAVLRGLGEEAAVRVLHDLGDVDVVDALLFAHLHEHLLEPHDVGVRIGALGVVRLLPLADGECVEKVEVLVIAVHEQHREGKFGIGP